MAELGICIVNWNTSELLDRCLKSILQHKGTCQIDVVVVDNASTDGSVEMIRERHPWARLIANTENRYYAAANNQGLKALHTPFKLLLNPDIEVLPGALQALLDFMRTHPQAGAAAPRLRGPDGRIQYSCRTFPRPEIIFFEALGLSRLFPRSRIFGKYRMSYWDYNEERPVEQPMASALLLRQAALDDVGLFDEQFPMFFNDVDLCQRLWEAGWEIWLAPQAEMIHIGGAATRLVRREMIIESHRSFIRYYEKHYRGKIHPLIYAATIGLLKVGLWARLGFCPRRPAKNVFSPN